MIKSLFSFLLKPVYINKFTKPSAMPPKIHNIDVNMTIEFKAEKQGHLMGDSGSIPKRPIPPKKRTKNY